MATPELQNFTSNAAAIAAADAGDFKDKELISILTGGIGKWFTNEPGSSATADGVNILEYTGSGGGRLVRSGAAQPVLHQRWLICSKADSGAAPAQFGYASDILHTVFADETEKYHLISDATLTPIDASRIASVSGYLIAVEQNKMVYSMTGKLNGDKFFFPRPEAESTLAVAIVAGTTSGHSVSIAAIRLVSAAGTYKEVAAADGIDKFNELGIETGYDDDATLGNVWPVVPNGGELILKPVNAGVMWSAIEVVLSADVPGDGAIGAHSELMPEPVSPSDLTGRLLDDTATEADRTISAGAFGYRIDFISGSGIALSNVTGSTFGSSDSAVVRETSTYPTGADVVVTIPSGASVRVWETR